MKNELNEDLIRIIEETLSGNVNIANTLMEILNIGKEATYRRLRSEVPFSFYEVSLIAKKLGLSLDRLIGNFDEKTAVFNLNLINSHNAMADYCDTLGRYIRYLEFIKDDPETVISTASNTIPFIFYTSFPYISRFRICRWLHQSENLKPPGTLDQIIVPKKIEEMQIYVNQLLKKIPLTYLIWDSNIFYSLVKEIEYFAMLRYISQEDILKLKEEMLSLIEYAEKLATEGTFNGENKVLIYLSNIHFEASYSYLEKGDFQICLLRLYSVNSMDSLHPDVCRIQREWIQTLKRYSTLITESGEMQRISFFNKQREYIENL